MAIKVLVVDDSAFMRKLISEILNEQPDIEVVGTARNGLDAINKLERLSWDVDVVTLDLEMPVLDGLSTIEQIMTLNPLPILVLASMTERSSESTIKALSYGALDFIAKPSGNISLDLRKVDEELVAKVRSLAGVVVNKPLVRDYQREPKQNPKRKAAARGDTSENIVVIGSSTGGPKALEELFLRLPADLNAGILVVQHMPKNFTKSLASRLNNLSQIEVREAQEGDIIKNGLALVAPGDFHLEVDQEKRILLNQNPPVKYLRPAIDVTMLSLVNVFQERIIGVILTGMGNDGSAGMAAIKASGGYTIVQDRSTSTIFSMPKAVYEQGNADYVLPIEQIADSIVKLVKRISEGS
ncbi:MAG: chemotaxis response regulator protein-glutamate methylesterase [Firmicutes bacterium]|nr:chemotaxis response regulator protein-glutamate methylesterase [Bacillota bacterium]